MNRIRLTKDNGEVIELGMNRAALTRMFQAILDVAGIENGNGSDQMYCHPMKFTVEFIPEENKEEGEEEF